MMTILLYIVFYLSLLAHITGAGLSMVYLKNGENRFLGSASRFNAIGAILLLLSCGIRFSIWQEAPLSNATDFVNLFMLMVSITGFVITRAETRRALLTFYLPPLALFCLFAGYTAIPDLSLAPKALPSIFISIHVVTAVLAYGLFFVASLTSIAYAYVARRLKQGIPRGLVRKLPSLENMDRTLFLLIRMGYPVFAITVLQGAYWAWSEKQLLSPNWWLDPKIFMSILMLFFYGFTYHGRSLSRLRGPKLAYALFAFGTFLGCYLLLKATGILPDFIMEPMQ